MDGTPAPDVRRLTVARCDQLLAIYTPWLDADSAATREAARHAVAGLVYERQAALARGHA